MRLFAFVNLIRQDDTLVPRRDAAAAILSRDLAEEAARVSGSKGVSGGTSVTMFFGAGLPIILSSILCGSGCLAHAICIGSAPSSSFMSSAFVSKSLQLSYAHLTIKSRCFATAADNDASSKQAT